MVEKTESIKDYKEATPTEPSKYPPGFYTDGCSGGMSRYWRKFFKKAPPWEGCCIAHDVAYWRGGFWYDRKQADLEMAACVKNQGHPIWAFLMYWAVRIGGVPWLPLPWRWGYGWKFVGRYEKRPPSEKKLETIKQVAKDNNL